MRRSTVKGRTTSWYLLRLKLSRSSSAMLQMKLTFSEKLSTLCLPPAWLPGSPGRVFARHDTPGERRQVTPLTLTLSPSGGEGTDGTPTPRRG